MEEEFADLLSIINQDLSAWEKKRRILKEVDLFVLDNSLRESTVGQLRGHTLKNKWSIFNEVKKCGFDNIIISAFSHVPRVDDAFVKQLSEQESDMSKYFAFSEIGEGVKKQDLPIGLQKMEKYKIRNPIFEINLVSSYEDEESLKVLYDLLQRRIDYSYEKLAPDAKILVNLRDFAPAMSKCPRAVFKVVKFLASMPPEKRIFGIIFEEPSGDFLPAQMGTWTKSIRYLMNKCGWNSAHLLAHIHKKWEFGEVAQLECLANGANGIWASVCEEGAALGHACSIISIMNLVRMGNTKVLNKYNCHYLRQAAINVTQITIGTPPHPKQTLYGHRALDIVLDTGSGKTAEDQPDSGAPSIDLGEFFGVRPPLRITTLASPRMVQERLVHLFGEDAQFTEEIAENMKAAMITDLTDNAKEEYMSAVGIALLFEQAGGKITGKMEEVIMKKKMKSHEHEQLIKEVREIWDEWDFREGAVDTESLEFHSFYNGFMAPYFGCYECDITKRGLEAIDMHNDGKVDWPEFCVYLKWALNEYPDIATTEELLTTAFQKGLIPHMRDGLSEKPPSE